MGLFWKKKKKPLSYNRKKTVRIDDFLTVFQSYLNSGKVMKKGYAIEPCLLLKKCLS